MYRCAERREEGRCEGTCRVSARMCRQTSSASFGAVHRLRRHPICSLSAPLRLTAYVACDLLQAQGRLMLELTSYIVPGSRRAQLAMPRPRCVGCFS